SLFSGASAFGSSVSAVVCGSSTSVLASIAAVSASAAAAVGIVATASFLGAADLLCLLVAFSSSSFGLLISLKSTSSIIAISAASPGLNPVLMILVYPPFVCAGLGATVLKR